MLNDVSHAEMLKRPRVLAFFLILMLVLGTVAAQTTTTPSLTSTTNSSCPPPAVTTFINQQNYNLPSAAGGLAILALTFSFDVIAIMYALNKLFPTAQIGKWLQDEIKETIKSMIVIAVIFSVITIVSGLALSLTGASAGTYGSNIGGLVTQSETYLCGVSGYLMNSFAGLTSLQLAYGALSSLKTGYAGLELPPVPIGGLWALLYPTFQSGAKFNIYANGFLNAGSKGSLMNDIVSDILFPAVNIYIVQVSLLPLLVVIGITVLIPMGIILRAFPLVRGIGGTLLAFGMALALFWPAMLVLFNAPVSAYFYSVLVNANQVQTGSCATFGIIAPVCSGISSLNYLNGATGAAIGSAAGPLGTLVGSITGTFSGTAVGNSFWTAFNSLNSIYPSLNYILSYTIYIIFQMLFLFVFDLIVVYTITEDVAKLLGGSVRLSFGKRLKLI